MHHAAYWEKTFSDHVHSATSQTPMRIEKYWRYIWFIIRGYWHIILDHPNISTIWHPIILPFFVILICDVLKDIYCYWACYYKGDLYRAFMKLKCTVNKLELELSETGENTNSVGWLSHYNMCTCMLWPCMHMYPYWPSWQWAMPWGAHQAWWQYWLCSGVGWNYASLRHPSLWYTGKVFVTDCILDKGLGPCHHTSCLPIMPYARKVGEQIVPKLCCVTHSQGHHPVLIN